MSAVVASAFVACSGPQATGTKTNWLKACDSSLECGEEGACVCGLCTMPCSGDDQCGQGVCGSGVATAAQCADFMDSADRLCLQEEVEEICHVAPLAVDGELGISPPASCVQADALICESFDAQLPSAYSTWVTGEAEAALVDCESYLGGGALLLESVGSGRAQTRFRLPEPIDSGELHARFFVRIAAESQIGLDQILFETWAQEEGEVDTQSSLYVNEAGQLSVYVAAGNHVIAGPDSGLLPRDTWVCIEVATNISDTEGSMRVSADGVELIAETGLDTLPGVPLAVAVLSSNPVPDSPPGDVSWMIDEFVLARSPIGCD